MTTVYITVAIVAFAFSGLLAVHVESGQKSGDWSPKQRRELAQQHLATGYRIATFFLLLAIALEVRS